MPTAWVRHLPGHRTLGFEPCSLAR